MKIILFLAVLAAGFWLARGMMVKAQQAEDQRRGNAAVRYTQNLQQSEQRAKQTVDRANKVMLQQTQDVNQAVDAGQ